MNHRRLFRILSNNTPVRCILVIHFWFWCMQLFFKEIPKLHSFFYDYDCSTDSTACGICFFFEKRRVSGIFGAVPSCMLSMMLLSGYPAWGYTRAIIMSMMLEWKPLRSTRRIGDNQGQGSTKGGIRRSRGNQEQHCHRRLRLLPVSQREDERPWGLAGTKEDPIRLMI